MHISDWAMVVAIFYIVSVVVRGDIFDRPRYLLRHVPIVGGAIACLLCLAVWVSGGAVWAELEWGGTMAWSVALRLLALAGLSYALSELVRLLSVTSNTLNKHREWLQIQIDVLEAEQMDEEELDNVPTE